MTNLELEGRIVQKMAVQSGQSARGAWARQDFVVEYQDGSFPTSVCFSAWGQDKVQELDKYQVGDSVKVSFNVKGREYNGRWYNDLRVWRISPAGAAPAAASAPTAAPAVPSFHGPSVESEGPAYSAPAPTVEDMPTDFGSSAEEDFPF